MICCDGCGAPGSRKQCVNCAERLRSLDCGTLGGFRTSRDGRRQAKLAFAHAVHTD
jgi:hypothetical protein